MNSPVASPPTSLQDEDEDEVVFIDELPEYLKCPICLSCLKDPYQTPCGHRFCKNCIYPILISPRNNMCPNDRTQIDSTNTFPDNAVKLQINNLHIMCSHEGCDWKGTYSDRKEHQLKCKFARAPCELCQALICKTEMDAHLVTCPKKKVKCDHCWVEVSRDQLNSHHMICPEFPVQCEYSCSIGSYPRKDLHNHYNECPNVPVPCPMAPFGCLESVERRHLSVHLAECAPRHASNMGAMVLKLQKEVESLKSQLKDHSLAIQQVDETLYPCAGQFTWRIDDIREKIKAAQAGDPATSVIYSPPFYSSEAGYKLCLCIYPAGDHNQGYLSLYFVVMKGKYDEVLQWPFQKRVYLSLLSCRGGVNVIKEITPDPRLHYFHRPENPRNVGYGYPKFMHLPRLVNEDSEHVQNGAIFLRCKVLD